MVAGVSIPFAHMRDTSTGSRLERFVRARWTRHQGGIRKLADNAGIDKDTLYMWFRGDGEPSLSSLRGLATALNVERADIVAAMDGLEPQSAAPPKWARRPMALVNLLAVRSGITEAEIDAEADRIAAEAVAGPPPRALDGGAKRRA